ncbi:glycosyltransferase family 4 protein [Variovorax sp.]|uniref:glycosyltransferase family 4 protein n=1 Tax=Variovorax sp. TaxID=1871043 RepID=UPI002D54F3D0|nr:glycosyltransferase family 4 protein [Variovorax sp.]HYP82889.1 glycosyltransferase family 4 protein [Variovorax sp.]
MSKDVVADRYARLYEIPRQLAMLGHDVVGLCLDYQGDVDGEWTHDGGAGRLRWRSRALRPWVAHKLATYPFTLLRELREFAPDVLIGASDIPHVALGAWLAQRLRCGYVADLYDNFEGFGQAQIPGFVAALRWGVRHADLVTTTSELLRDHVIACYPPRGAVLAMPSSVDFNVFLPYDQAAARKALGLPLDAKLIGTAGGLYREKGVEPLYAAWGRVLHQRRDVHLVLAGPIDPALPPPEGERVHYLGQLPHEQVAQVFSALDIGVISVLDTPFGRYCFPQKAYEMLACGLPVVAANVGATGQLFSAYPQLQFSPADADGLAAAIMRQLEAPVSLSHLPIRDWTAQVSALAQRLPELSRMSGATVRP